MSSHEVIVEFGSSVYPDMQGRAMLHLEKFLRENGVPVEVFKRTMPDDSRLRRSMTLEVREKL